MSKTLITNILGPELVKHGKWLSGKLYFEKDTGMLTSRHLFSISYDKDRIRFFNKSRTSYSLSDPDLKEKVRSKTKDMLNAEGYNIE